MFKDYYSKYPPYSNDSPSDEMSDERISSVKAAVLAKINDTEKELIMDKSTNNSAVKIAKKFSKKAVIIPIAAALALGTITAGAAGFGLFDRFSRYFYENSAAEAQLDAAGITEFEKQFELDDYTVTVNGFMGDRFTILVSYDIDYKAEKYFENGEVKQEFKDISPVMFFQNNGGGGAEGSRSVSVNGSRVSYVQLFDIASGLETNGGEYTMQLRATFADTTNMGDLMRGTLCEPQLFGASFPISKEISIPVDSSVTLPDKRSVILKTIDISPLTIRFTTGIISDLYSFLADKGSVVVTLADGREIDLSAKDYKSYSWQERPDEEVTYWQYDTVIDVSQITKIKFSSHTFTIRDGSIVDTAVEE